VNGGTLVCDGSADVQRAASALAERLPQPLSPLARLAYNYRWSWAPGGHELFAAIDAERFELCARNPVRLLQESSQAALERAAADESLVARAHELQALLEAELSSPPAAGSLDPGRPAAFLCAEYGVHVSLPLYAGGLGALAGDLLKEASDRRIPLVAVGLMYRRGYFRQRVDASGWQQEYWLESDPERLPAVRVSRADGAPLTVEVPIGGQSVSAYVWRVEVGRVPLYLLDADVPSNGPLERFITARLYDADPQTRLAQYVLLGVGGVLALRAVGIEPGVVHLNEGHAAFAPLALAFGERLEERFGAGDASGEGADGWLDAALARARARTVFTTHTPVEAGNDAYTADQARAALGALAARAGFELERLLALGRRRPERSEEPFGMTELALRLSRAANGVSRRHGEVARAMWSPLWPELAPEQTPIGHVTNGVHVPTWIGPAMRELLDRHLGPGWIERADDPEVWARVDAITDEELWQARCAQRAELVALARERSVTERLLRGDVREYAVAAAQGLREDALTIGFARRVAAYKRLHLLTRDPEWTLRLLDGERPVQVLLAGKAHPRDEDAKRMLQSLFGLKWAQVVAKRVVFLDDYDLASAAALVRGCDVWLNVPRPPLEACGTSGMKSAFNGGLQLSVLDGWWAEAFDGANGWALPGEICSDHDAQDARDAAALHEALQEQVLPAFYERDERGLPLAWLARIRASLRSIGPRFCATRMLREYLEGPYREG
jgi:starch phosphorylase